MKLILSEHDQNITKSNAEIEKLHNGAKKGLIEKGFIKRKTLLNKKKWSTLPNLVKIQKFG